MKIMKSRKIALAAGFIILLMFALGSGARNRLQKNDDIYHDLEIFAKIVERVSSNYVEEVDTHKLMQDAIEAMLKDLDPHSQFLSGLYYEDLMMSTRGEYGGLGMYISLRDHYPTVVSPIEETPAFKVGIKGGDQITEIEDMDTRDWGSDKAVKYLRGKPGTRVRFKISRPGLSEPIAYELKREIIQIHSVPYSGKFNDFGYIKVANFARQTRNEIREALKNLEKQKIKGLIMDLRTNPGGLLQSATEVSELFLEKDKLIVYTKGRLPNSNQKYYSGNSHVHDGYPVVVMVNGASASASEIFAGALQDWDSGFIIGQPTFGKGSVQTVFSLSDSEAIKLTTAKYYTPSGRSINIDHTKDLADEGKAGRADSISIKEEEKESKKEKPVFNTASGRVVYGGGGITPDLELKPQHYTEFQRRLERDALFFSFVVEYCKTHKIKDDFQVTDAVFEDFKSFLKEREFEYTDEDLTEDTEHYIRVAILREIASKNFGRKAMYKVLLDNDKELKEAISLLEKAPTLQALYSYAAEQQGTKKASLE